MYKWQVLCAIKIKVKEIGLTEYRNVKWRNWNTVEKRGLNEPGTTVFTFCVWMQAHFYHQGDQSCWVKSLTTFLGAQIGRMSCKTRRDSFARLQQAIKLWTHICTVSFTNSLAMQWIQFCGNYNLTICYSDTLERSQLCCNNNVCSRFSW